MDKLARALQVTERLQKNNGEIKDTFKLRISSDAAVKKENQKSTSKLFLNK